MAEIPSDQSPTLAPPQSGSDSSQYWCYSCDKRVAIETLADLAEVVCFECKNGFVEAISATTGVGAEEDDEPDLDGQFLQILRLIARHVRDEYVAAEGPLPVVNLDPTDEDYLHVELNEWDEVEEEEEEEEEVEDLHSVEVVNEEEGDVHEHLSDESRSDGEEDEDEEEEEEGENEVIELRDDEDPGERRRRLGLSFVEFAAQAANRVNRSDDGEAEEENEVVEHAEEDERAPVRWGRVFTLRDRDFTTQSDSRRNRILDWAEVLMGLEDHSIELRIGESDTYVGNPGDYVDAAQYETLLQNLAESDGGGRRGAPPASKAAVEALQSVVIGKEEDIMGCAICKDYVNVGEVAKNMPCGHGYHGECIVPWLDSRNSCPVCRFELPTDDPEYEEDRKKRGVAAGVRVESTSSSAAAGGDHGGSGLE